jgi:hypothetical protein
MPEDRFEETKLKITADVTRGIFEAEKKANITFHQERGEPRIENKELKVPVVGQATHKVSFPKVKPTENHVVLNYEVACEGAVIGANQFRVWPKTLEIEAKLENGDPAAGFQFKINQGGQQSDVWTAKDDGKCEAKLMLPTDAAIVAMSPWEFAGATNNVGQPRKRTLTVRKKTWKAKFKEPHHNSRKPDAPFKQWVNLPTDPANAQGHIMKLEVGPLELNYARQGEEIKVRVTFPATNSVRRSPLPALQTGEAPSTAVALKDPNATPGLDDLVYEADVQIPRNGRRAVFYVNLGVAGGDKCKIEVGVTDSHDDDVLWVQNWRKLGIEMLIPDVAIRQNCSHLLAKDKAALADPLIAELKRIFDKTYLELEFRDADCHTFSKDQLEQSGQAKGTGRDLEWSAVQAQNLIIDADKLWMGTVDQQTKKEKRQKLNKGAQVFIARSPHHLQFIRSIMRGNNDPVPPRTLLFRFCDLIASRASKSRSSPLSRPKEDKLKDMSKITNSFIVESMEKNATKETSLDFHVFETDPITAANKLGITHVRWKAKRYAFASNNPAWMDVGQNTPGAQYRKWTRIEFPDLATMKKWVEIKDSRHVVVKLPKDNDDDPGKVQKIRGDDGNDYLLDISLEFRCYGVEFTSLGEAIGATITYNSQSSTEGMASTIAHEICHAIGQTYTEEVPGEDGGHRPENEIDGVPFERKTHEGGQYYVGKGDTGPHCAKHVVDYAEKHPDVRDAILSARDWNPPPGALEYHFDRIPYSAACVMYGHGKPLETYKLDLCPVCKRYVRAADLSDLNKFIN